jgi:hypothetical protein
MSKLYKIRHIPTGKFLRIKLEIEGMTLDIYNELTNSVRGVSRTIKGELSDQDQRAINFQILGKLSMTYKNWLPDLFKEHFIVDLDLRTSGIKVDKASFLNLEITFFTKENLEFKSDDLSNELNHILKEVHDNVLKKSKFSGFFHGEVLKNIPSIENNYTDEEIFDYFGLSKEERELIQK